MKIALLHYSAPPVVGGVESVLVHHARMMADAGHNVRVIAGRGAPFDPRVQFVSLPIMDSLHADILAIKAELDAGRVPASFGAVAREIRRALEGTLTGVDAAIAHNVCSLHKNLALTAALNELSQNSPGPGLVLWHHDLAWTTPRYRAELHEGYPWDLLRTDWPGAVQVVVSELRRKELAELIGVPLEKIRVIPNGVNAGRFLGLAPQTQEFVHQLDLLRAAPLLLLPVRITSRKNIELALHILAALRRDFPSAALVITGPLGPHNPANAQYFARLKSLRAQLGLEEAAHFLSEISDEYLPDEIVADFYRLADALLLPSREEGFGIPVIEAGLARLPVFCADIPPLREIGGGSATYFSPDADPHRVAALIAERLSADPIYTQRVRVRSNYTWEGIYAAHIEPLLRSCKPRTTLPASS